MWAPSFALPWHSTWIGSFCSPKAPIPSTPRRFAPRPGPSFPPGCFKARLCPRFHGTLPVIALAASGQPLAQVQFPQSFCFAYRHGRPRTAFPLAGEYRGHPHGSRRGIAECGGRHRHRPLRMASTIAPPIRPKKRGAYAPLFHIKTPLH